MGLEVEERSAGGTWRAERPYTPSTETALVFQSTMEGFARRFGKELPAGVRGRLERLGVDLTQLQRVYPLAVFDELVRVTGAALYPELPFPRQAARMGRELVCGYAQTLVGRAAVGIGRIIGPRRMLELAEQNWCSGCNHLEVVSAPRGDRDMEVTARMKPRYVDPWRDRETCMEGVGAGILEGTLEVIGVRSFEVGVVERDLSTQRFSYRVQWEP